MTGSYCGLWFLHMPEEPKNTDPLLESIYQLNDTIYLKTYPNNTDASILEKYTCHWNCTTDNKFHVYLSNSTYINTMYTDERNISCSFLHMTLEDVRQGEVTCLPKKDCNLLCFEDLVEFNRSKREIDSSKANSLDMLEKDGDKKVPETVESEGSFYVTVTFWAFVVLMCIGTVAFNVANCIGDAVCFDVLGKLNKITIYIHIS